MKLIVGLGNPGISYEESRHNVGFRVIDLLVRECGINVNEIRYRSLVGEGRVAFDSREVDIVLLKPQTYMNSSGLAVGPALAAYGLPASHLVVVYDDMDLEVGKIRIRPKGGGGGHRGMRSIIQTLETQEFPRVRIGIGRPVPGLDPVDYVLDRFDLEELPKIQKGLEKAVSAVKVIVSEGVDSAMNRFNRLDSEEFRGL